MSHLDELFEKSFQEKLQLLQQEWLDFRESHEHWTELKIYKEILFKLRKECDKTVESKFKSIGKPDVIELVSEFKRDLFTWFQSRHNDYKVNAVYHFMQEDYPKLRKRFDAYSMRMPIVMFPPEISYPLNEVFKEELVVKELAIHEAILKFILKLEVEESDILVKQRYPKILESTKPNETAELTFPDDVHDLITKGNDIEAAKRLSSYLKENEFPADFFKDAIQIQAIFANAENDFSRGRINPADKSLQFNRARPLILDLLERIKKKNENP